MSHHCVLTRSRLRGLSTPICFCFGLLWPCAPRTHGHKGDRGSTETPAGVARGFSHVACHRGSRKPSADTDSLAH